MSINVNVRVCKKCLKKQREVNKHYKRWVNFSVYTKEEKRESALREILKGEHF